MRQVSIAFFLSMGPFDPGPIELLSILCSCSYVHLALVCLSPLSFELFALIDTMDLQSIELLESFGADWAFGPLSLGCWAYKNLVLVGRTGPPSNCSLSLRSPRGHGLLSQWALRDHGLLDFLGSVHVQF